jgi:hypothetical protein
VPAAETVAREELPSAGLRQADDVLDVGHGGRDAADDRRVERAARPGEKEDGDRPARHLEAP